MEALIGPGIIAALIAGVVSILGWTVAHIREQRTQDQLRDERIRDYMTALRCEIRTNSYQHSGPQTEAHIADTTAQILANPKRGQAYTPFIPREVEPAIFAAIVKEIHILPGSVIDPVILYYSQVAAILQFTEDLRSERYQQLTSQRKAAMYLDYMEMRAYAAELAEGAINAIDEVTDAR